MTFQPKARHKGPRWLVLLAVLMLGSTAFAISTSAAHFPTSFPNAVEDDAGANDEPGQKDLTLQGSVIVSGTLYSMWQWDDTSWSGKNTGDGCSLFSDDGDAFVDYALCATVGTQGATLQTVSVYSCNNTREDRCAGPTLLTTDNTLCEINNNVTGPFDGSDTQAVCNATASGIPTTAVLLNTCSYPSREPNSDPSDCVLTVANVDTTVSTLSAGTIAWQATLSDSATLSPNTATGSVTFKLYSSSTCSDASLLWTSDPITVVNGAASSGTTGGSPSGGNVITNLANPGNGEYYWIATYTPTGAFNPDSSLCGEKVTIVSTVTGSSGS